MKNNKGQAIFEFLVFVPLLIALYGIIVNITGAINSSINQQKATRGYFYNIIKGSSMFPAAIDLNGLIGITNVNFFMIGYRKKSSNNGSDSYSPCYKMQALLDDGETEDCDNPKTSGIESQFIRVYTGYGVCGPTFTKVGNGYINNFAGAGVSDCSNR